MTLSLSLRTSLTAFLMVALLLPTQFASAATIDDLRAAVKNLQAAMAQQSAPAGAVLGTETIVVSNSNELASALAAADGGETIQVNPGTYDALTLSKRYGSTVTITSARTSNKAIIGEELLVQNAANITFDQIDFIGATANGTRNDAVIKIDNSENIVVRNGNVIPAARLIYAGWGSADNKYWTSGYANGIDIFDGSENVTIENMSIKHSEGNGVKMTNVNRVNILNSFFSEMRGDGIKVTKDNSNLVFSGNRFTNFMNSYEALDGTTGATTEHSDIIQLSNGSTIDGLEITNNVALNAVGDPTQGLWTSASEISNFSIRNNFFQTGMVQAFKIFDGTNGVIENNTVIPVDESNFRNSGHYPDTEITGSNITVRNNVFVTKRWKFNQGVPVNGSNTVGQNSLLVSDDASHPAYYQKAYDVDGDIADITLDDLDSLRVIDSSLIGSGHGYAYMAGAQTSVTTPTPAPTPELTPDPVEEEPAEEDPVVEDPIPETSNNLLSAQNIIATSNNFASNHEPANLFDGCTTTAQGCSAGSNQAESFWVEFDLGAIYDLNEAQLFGDTNGTWVSRTWTLEGKERANDQYGTLFDDENVYGDRWFTERVNDEARYVRITVSGTDGSNRVQAMELRLTGEQVATPASAEDDTTNEPTPDPVDDTPAADDEPEEADEPNESVSPVSNNTRVRTTDNLNVRATAGGTLRGVQFVGARGTLDTSQPRVTQGGYQWVFVDFDTSPDGWVAEEFLAEIASTPTTDIASMSRAEIIALIRQLLMLIMAQQAQ